MAQDIKIWNINESGELFELNKASLDLEKKLEDWMVKDITMISDDLLVIGRQIQTDFGGIIDILCLDPNGDIVIVELKRDKTPREITAQILDYASWVKDLSNEKIVEIAHHYLPKASLEKSFFEKFDVKLPDVLNEHHKMLIVASSVDDSTERIINYLSDEYGVGINVVTFQYFKDKNKEFISRVFLIEPAEADYRTQTKTQSKRKPPLSFEEQEEIAKKNGVYDMYDYAMKEFKNIFESTVSTRSTISFIGKFEDDDSRKTIFNLVPGDSSKKEGLAFMVRYDRFADYFKINQQDVRNILPEFDEEKIFAWQAAENGGGGYFTSIDEIINTIKKIKNLTK